MPRIDDARYDIGDDSLYEDITLKMSVSGGKGNQDNERKVN